MREDILLELENEYEQKRIRNEQEEFARKEKIRIEQPDIYALTKKRENLIFDTLKDILKGQANTEDLPEKMEKISLDIRNLLEEKGYAPNYLAPIYECTICKDTGKVGKLIKEPCECLKRAYQKKLREKIGLQSEKKESFDNFDLSLFSDVKKNGAAFSQRALMKIIRDDCQEWADKYPHCSHRDVFISGKSGLGKTFLLRSMADRLIERDINVIIISAFKMLEIFRRNYFDNDDSASILFNTEVLMIDDLGSEPLMKNVTIEQLFNVINERQSKGLSTLISTNLSIEEFKERYTERISSRLNDVRNCLIITLSGTDIRNGSNKQA